MPAPIAPHLAAEWLLWSLRQHLGAAAVRQVPFVDEFGGLPYEYLSPGGDRFISAAGWVCPPICRAGKKCPAILAPRTWDLNDTIRAFKELCEGKWDHLPEAAFHMVGTIEEAAEKAKKLEAGA